LKPLLTLLLRSARSTLIDAHPFFRRPVSYLLANIPALRQYVFDVPKGYLGASVRRSALLQPAEAKMCVPRLSPTLSVPVAEPH